MKKCFKIFLSILFIWIIFTFGNHVEANSISKISMDIYVDSIGNANITEVWNCYSSQGTEVYHPYYNLGKSKIKNLTVSEDGKNYQTLSSWKTSGTLSDKAYKCGINRISNGVELCWGISSYGSHTYTVKYTITNFVSSLKDSQMIYWTLIPYDFSDSIENVYIKIHAGFPISDTVDVWGYGNKGTAYVYNGYIEMQSDGRLPQDDYMTILVKFPADTFQTSNQLNNDFNHYYKMAEEGAVHQEGSSQNLFFSRILPISLAFSPLIFIIFCVMSSSASQPHYDLGNLEDISSENIVYFRDFPCHNDLYRVYYIAYRYGILKNKTDLLGAIILKWLKDGLIKIDVKETGMLFKKENAVVILNETNPKSINNEDETVLFSMLYEASKDGILENKEFENWCSQGYSELLSWFDSMITKEQKKLINEGNIVLEKKKKFKMFTQVVYKFMPILRKEAAEITGLKKYLLDYSLINEREAIEVHIFEEYLIYAQMLGIAEKVAQQFKELYPRIVEQSHYTSYEHIMFVHSCASSGISHAKSAKSKAESRANNYSSGGGGFSSSGGGGGSFGGGGGGGGFR